MTPHQHHYLKVPLPQTQKNMKGIYLRQMYLLLPYIYVNEGTSLTKTMDWNPVLEQLRLLDNGPLTNILLEHSNFNLIACRFNHICRMDHIGMIFMVYNLRSTFFFT